MSTYTVDISQLAGLNCTDLSIINNSRAADTAELSFRADSFLDNAPWKFGDSVKITSGKDIVFSGYVTSDPEYTVAANQRGFSIRLENIVGLLDATPYTGKQSFDGTVTNEARLVSVKTVINNVLSNGMVLPGGAEAPETYSVKFSNTVQCPIGSGTQSCWSLVNSCLHWVPDAVTWYNPQTGVLSLRRADDGDALVVDLANRRVRRGNVELFSFAGYTDASFRARRDLCPPAVSLSWENGKEKTFGGTPRQPWAFRMEIPNKAGGGDADTPQQQRNSQKAAAQKMVVRGHKVPAGWSNTGDMKTASGKPGEHQKFWSHFSAMRALAKTNASCLDFGTAVFEAVPLDDAFPIDEEDAEDDNAPGQPANYKEFVASAQNDTNIYFHHEGSFPASKESRDNVSGLRFCRGILKQYVWLKAEYVGELSAEKWMEFFSGTATFTDANGTHKCRYALLTLEGNFINRRRKVYMAGTNEIMPSDPDWVEDESLPDGSPNEPSDSDYISAASDYYNATRKLFFDGTITLHGVKGYLPSKIDSSNLNIVGGRDEWENMNTPVVRALWKPAEGSLELSTGSPEILTIDERIQRQQLGRQSSHGAGTSFATPPSMYESTEPDAEEQAFPMISPSVNAEATVTASGKPLNPFELYEKGGKWYLNEGTLVAPGGKIIAFETTDVTERVVENPSAKFSVRAERKRGSQEWEAVIRTFN